MLSFKLLWEKFKCLNLYVETNTINLHKLLIQEKVQFPISGGEPENKMCLVE